MSTRLKDTLCIFPEDSDAGGTWIGVNEDGLCACLLNFYRHSITAGSAEYVSRGLLVRSILDSPERSVAIDRVMASNPTDYRFFSMLLFDPTSPPVLLRWTGQDDKPEIIDNPTMPKSSSSFRTAEVVASRKDLYGSWSERADVGGPLMYHRSHEPERGPYSVCMHREDAKTVSFSHITVTRNTVAFDYTPGSPCSTAALPSITIPRRE